MSSVQSAIPKLGARNTRQRTAVIQVLNELDNFASAKAIHHELVHRDSQVGLTTVYRTLQSLSEIDAVDVLHMPSGETLYRSCESHHHHHHLVCTSCGRTEEIDGGPVERWAQEVVANYGFQLTGHDAEVFGICAKCSKKQDSASAK
ncbi:transcriptional repressor [Corynebacterium propinquum]|uniref:Fur family transcriptional regulator n=1 Tax=Corynebacterium propinquum TaxID=43769 RepID=UPI00266F3317|nr:Fur family transcriptional regulator [Corynebacterium propinquum]WKS31734.1 transcriptional repressor [Corynebacterium propinquum]WKS36063.1 transcriptional repressor [Corynebacterium propinquum]WKS38229.1 transcriptional repressor [Corynebacterium propinquum]WKS42684.1 transcriptional repressor [Corynebacterium propinquum]WKS46980.1 transcriptional repressor [Corynebacterium propinquum]